MQILLMQKSYPKPTINHKYLGKILKPLKIYALNL